MPPLNPIPTIPPLCTAHGRRAHGRALSLRLCVCSVCGRYSQAHRFL
eukprot:SAG11_NODE_791_length_7146_cov_49.170427_4_plen_47_part_00